MDLSRRAEPADVHHAWDTFDLLPQPIAIVDHSGAIVALNAAWQQSLERQPALAAAMPADNIVRLSAAHFQLTVDAAAELAHGLEAVLRGEHDQITLELRTSNGAASVAATITPLSFAGQRGALVQQQARHTPQAELEHSHQDELRQIIISTAPFIVFAVDRDGNFTFFDGGDVATLGLAPAYMIGRSAFQIYGDQPHIVDNLRRALNGAAFSAEITMNGKTYEARYTPLHAADGTVSGAVGITFNITEQKRAEDALREGEERFRRLSEVSTEGIAIHENGAILDSNQALARLFGYDPADMTGKSAFDLVHPTSHDPLRSHMAEATSEPYEVLGVRKDGSTFPVEILGRLLAYEGRNVRVVTLRDMTTQKQAEAALRESLRQAEIIRDQANRLDELSTPLFPLSQRVVLMPLIGTLDTRRAHHMIETLLAGIAAHRAHKVLVDITGVAVVDTHVANVLIQAAQAARLLGAAVIITGIRPEVAQTLIGLGVDLRGVATRGTLQDGVAAALTTAA